MTLNKDTRHVQAEVLALLRNSRRELHEIVTSSEGMRERMFAPEQLVLTLRAHVARCEQREITERRGKLLVLTVLLYAALDWQFAGWGIDVEVDVQIERMGHDHVHGGAHVDDKLSAEDWRARMQEQLAQLERNLPPSQAYSSRLVKFAALAQAALEAAYRKKAPQEERHDISQAA